MENSNGSPPSQSLSALLFSFEGRISRLPFWAVHICFMALGSYLGTQLGINVDREALLESGLAGTFIALVALWIELSLQTKRWHDRDKSAWWLLLNLLPVIGSIWILIECGFLRGTEGPNRFGPDPLEEED